MTAFPFFSKLNAKFLLDNTASTIVPLSELASKRQEYGDRDGVIDFFHHWTTKDGNMFWNAGHTEYYDHPKGVHYRNYWKLNSTQDLIDQFNYVGYHDICNYPLGAEINSGGVTHTWLNPKGFYYYYDGFGKFNQTGRLLPRKCFRLFLPFIKL